MRHQNLTLALGLLGSIVAGNSLAAEAQHGNRIARLDHAFVIVMENHAASQILGNAAAPFTNAYAHSANLANNYFGVGHPSLTNYLEIVGGSNFAVVNDNYPDWHNGACTPDLLAGTVSLEGSPSICPIAGSGIDGATPAVDTTNEGSSTSPVYNDPIAPAPTVGRTIADQLTDEGLSWKSYQESLPAYGADGVNWSDGLLSNTTAPVTGVPHLYAVKHNPFAYFANIQSGSNPASSLRNSVGFDRLYADLRSGNVPSYSLIAPNQCHDQHGRGADEVGPYCGYDPNPELIAAGDATLQNLIAAIKASPAWKEGNNVIVTVWDENDYGTEPNQVVTIVDTSYGAHGIASDVKYNHFSLLKTIEAGFRLPYLNHAADANVALMSDLFGR